jgi:hypothetical protein
MMAKVQMGIIMAVPAAACRVLTAEICIFLPRTIFAPLSSVAEIRRLLLTEPG